MPQRVIATADTLGGKPRLDGTRISVEFILELLASGASRLDILDGYPQVTTEGLEAALSYAARSMKNEALWDVKLPA